MSPTLPSPPHAPPATRTAPTLEDRRVVADLHCEVLASLDPAYGHGGLYSIGFVQGMLDGLRVSRGFTGLAPAPSGLPGPRIPMLLPYVGRAGARQPGTLIDSAEAQAHLRRMGPADRPVCHIATGYACGYWSALQRETWLVIERECVAAGDPACRFEALRASEALRSGEDWARALLPFLDFDRVTERLAEESEDRLHETADGDLVGALDPMSPAVHVWGPVVVLPYGGVHDSTTALEAVLRDPDAERIQVVIVDVTGARVDGVESLGLVDLSTRIRSRGIEVIVAGRRGARATGAKEALEVRDVTEGIALAFQICS